MSTGTAESSAAVAELNRWAASCPAVPAAAVRVVTQQRLASQREAVELRDNPQSRVVSEIRAVGGGGALKRAEGIAHHVLRLGLRPLLTGGPVGSDGQINDQRTLCIEEGGNKLPLEMHGASMILTAPGLVDALPLNVRERLVSPEGLRKCCAALQELIADDADRTPDKLSASSGASKAGGPAHDPSYWKVEASRVLPQQYLHAMLNLAALALLTQSDASVQVAHSF